jgi:hypothetical protein
VVSEHGYAGRVDLVAKVKGVGWAVIDFKTQKVRRNILCHPTPTFYETWPLQLAAYRNALTPCGTAEMPALVSVVIDSGHPGPVHIKVWKGSGYFDAFVAAITLWRYVKNYDPRQLKTIAMKAAD